MRLFVAIDLPDEARSVIAAEQRRVVAALNPRGRLTIVRAEHLHVTLAFIGEVDDGRGASIAECMAADIDQPAFDVVFSGIGVFPSRGAPRVLWMGMTSGADRTVHLQQCVSERLLAIGVDLDSRPFSPHLTLARWRESRPSDARRALAAGSKALALVRVTEVTLYQSRLSSAGPSYARLATAGLRS